MRRKLAFLNVEPATVADVMPPDACKTPQQVLAEFCLSQVKERNTFEEIGKMIGFGHEFVRRRLVPLYEKNPSIMQKIGKRYLVPRPTAEWFIKHTLGLITTCRP
jgi:hypothetical protein